MMNFRVYALLTFFLATPCLAFFQLELVARSGEYSSYGLSAPSILYNSDPAIDETGRVSFSYLGLDQSEGTFHRRFWVKPKGEKGGDLYQAKGQNMLSRPELNSRGDILFSEFNETKTRKVFIYRPSTDDFFEALNPKDYPETLGLSGLSFINTDDLVWRGLNIMGMRRLHSNTQSWENLLKEGQEQTSYIFVPQSKGQYLASKRRLGKERQWGERRPDQIVRWKFPERTFEVIAQDVDAKSTSQFATFHNNLGLNSHGDVVFVAGMADEKKGKAVVLKTQSQTFIIARESGDEISEIETFKPVINDQRVVVFRAKNSFGKRSLYAWAPKQGLKRIVGESDIVPSDVQTARILDSDWGPGLAGSPWINNRNQFVFQAVLESKRGEKRLGSAIYKVDLSW